MSIRFDPLSGQLVLGNIGGNFSYNYIEDVVEIETHQQMIVDGMLVIEGMLILDGELSII